MRLSVGICLCFTIGALTVFSAAADEPAYIADFALYKVHDTPIEILAAEQLNSWLNPDIEKLLDSPITVLFEDIAVSEVFNFIRKIYDLDLQMDPVDFPGQSANGYVIEYINLKSVSVREALAAILIPLKLNYWVDGSVIRVVKTPLPADRMPRNVNWYRPTKKVTVIATGAIRIGSSIIPLSSESPGRIPETANVTRIAAPHIAVTAGEHAKLEMTSVVQWLKPIPGTDGDFRLQHSASFEGTKLDLLLKEASNGQVNCTFTLTADSVRERHRVPGTTLDVGEPVFDTASGSADLIVTPGQTAALLTRLGANSDDVMLVLFRIDRGAGATLAVAQLPQYSVETKIIHVRGEPDWQWWLQPYARAYRIYEGAGRILGPVDATDFEDPANHEFKWSRLGFSAVKESAVLSSPRVTNTLNRRALIRDGKLPNPLTKMVVTSANPPTLPVGGDGGTGAQGDRKFTNIREVIGPVYNDLAVTPEPVNYEDLAEGGVSIIVDITESFENPPEGGPPKAKYRGVLAILEADSTDTPDTFRLQHSILINTQMDAKTKGSRKLEPHPLHAQFTCDYATQDGATAAFLLPIAADEYAIVLSTFNLINRQGQAATTRPYDIGIKAILIDGVPDMDAIRVPDAPDALELRDGSPSIFWPQNPYGYWNVEGMEREPQRFYFKSIAASKLVWDSTLPQNAKITPVADSIWTTYPNLLSPSGYRVPFSEETQARAKHILGVQMGGPTITDTEPGDPRPRGILAAYGSVEAEESWHVPRRLDEFIQFRLPVDLTSTDLRSGEELFYARSDASYKPHDNLLTAYLFPAGGSKFFLILSRFTMNSGASLTVKGWHEEPAAQ